jgi:1-acyl-sn-glycerol-3-phosphate acyltransferase
MGGGFAYWGILGISVTLIGGSLSYILPSRIGEPIGRKIHHLIFRYFITYLRLTGLLRADLSALDQLGKIPGPIIIAPNHSSLLDAVFIVARLPKAICVMKKSILCNPFLGGGSRLAGYIPNGCTTRMIRTSAEKLRQGGQLLLFPEGTRTDPSARWINPIKGGCALIAIRSKTPIFPVFIRSNTRFFQKGWPLWKPPIFPVSLQIDVGEPLFPRNGETASGLTSRLQSIYDQELARPHPLRRQIDHQF